MNEQVIRHTDGADFPGYQFGSYAQADFFLLNLVDTNDFDATWSEHLRAPGGRPRAGPRCSPDCRRDRGGAGPRHRRDARVQCRQGP